MARRDKIALLFWLCLSILVGIESWELGLGQFSQPGPGFLSFGMSVFIFIAVFAMVLKERGKKLVKKPEPIFRGKKIKNVIIGLFLIFVYYYLFNKIGLFLDTLLFVGLSLKLIEPHKWKVVLPISFGVSAGSYMLFVSWLQLQVPEPRWLNYLHSIGDLLWK